MSIQRNFLFGVFIIAVMVLGARYAVAQEGASGALVVRPAKIEAELAPGEKIEKKVLVRNGTTVPLELRLSFQDVTIDREVASGEKPMDITREGDIKQSLAPYATYPPEVIQLLSGKEVEIPVTLSVPATLEAGGRYGVLLVSASPFRSSLIEGQGVSLNSQIAVSFYVKIKGDIKEEGELKKFSLFGDGNFLKQTSEQDPEFFSITFENTGTVHLNPYGKVTVDPFIGDSRTFLIDPWGVLPGATRSRELAIRQDLAYGFNRATIELNRGYKDVVDTKSIWFIVLPRGLGWLYTILGLFAVGYLIYRSLRLSRYSLS